MKTLGTFNHSKPVSKHLRRIIVSFIFTCAVVMSLSQATFAQTMSSTAELKLACETSPGNTVVLTQNTQISTGPQAPLTETVNTKCTIIINPQVTFEVSQVSMTFKGALSIQAGNEGRALFLESTFAAPSVSVSLANLGELLVERSLLRASTGSLTVSSGVESRVDVRGPLAGGGLVANRSISLSGGQKFACTLTDAEVWAGSGISVNMTGAEAQFISTNSTMDTGGGSINITGSGEKSFAEFKLGSVATGRNSVNVTLNGTESVINANEFNFNSPAGGVFLRTGGSKGAVTLALGAISSGTVTTIQSSITGVEGKAVLQDASVTAGGDLKIESGSRGISEALDSTLTSSTLVRIATGSGGSCKSQNNIITAPAQQICP